MKTPCESLLSRRTLLRITRAMLVVWAGIAGTVASAQLIRADLSGPITGIEGTNPSLLGNDAVLGTPLQLSFTYEAAMPSDGIGGYVGTGGDILGEVQIGEFSYQIPRVRISLVSDTVYGSLNVPDSRADLIYLYTTDTPIGAPHIRIAAMLIYLPGTLENLQPMAPPPGFLISELSVSINEAGGTANAYSFNTFGDLPPISTVPEPAVTASLAALALLGLAVMRVRAAKRSATVDNERAGASGSSALIFPVRF